MPHTPLHFAAAKKVIEQSCRPGAATELPLTATIGRYCSRNYAACWDVPLCNNSAMDGYAIAHPGHDGPESFVLRGLAAAGDKPTEKLTPGSARRILTGALIPPGCDTVVQQEHVTLSGTQVYIPIVPALGKNIRRAGEDLPADQIFASAGDRITPAKAAAFAACGYNHIFVYTPPKIAILATGNELIAPGLRPQPGQVTANISVALGAYLRQDGFEVIDMGIASDKPAELAQRLRASLAQADVLITTGGVSVGDYDYVRPELEQIGVNWQYQRVIMKPGGPNCYGQIGAKHVFALPGNPSSALVVYLTLVRRGLQLLLGQKPEDGQLLWARLATDIPRRRPNMAVFTQVTWEQKGEILYVRPGIGQGSGMIKPLFQATALAHLPPITGTMMPAETPVAIYMLNQTPPN